MAAIPETHISEDRFAEYISELHEFSGSHRVPFGQPGDITGLLRGLRSSSSFASEFGSMIRSIVMRERFQASELDIFTVVAVAWGGVPQGDLMKDHTPPIEELRSVMQDLLRHGAIATITPAEPPAGQSSGEGKQPGSSVPQGQQRRISALRGFSSLKPMAAPILVEEQPRPRPSPGFRFHGYPSEAQEIPQIPRLDLSAGEIIATGLTGVIVAMLLTVGSLPLYRARVSVALPVTGSAKADPKNVDVASPASALVLGRLSSEVAEVLLERPHPSPTLKQDALSRAMRDLHLGGNETILYADLVAQTSHRVKVTRLDAPDVYEITCESWSAQFAATFCNELLGVLKQQPAFQSGSLQGSGSARIIDRAVGPGVQVYPHWYLQGLLGLAIGCLAGFSVGFIKRAEPKAARDDSEL